jgi:hypothetical protein
MKHLKEFVKFFEGKGRYVIKDNIASVGSTGLPQFWSTNDDYTEKSKVDSQEIGVDIKQMVNAPGNDYSYILDPDDHIDQKHIDKLVEPHVKKFSDFGFDPSKTSK